jgi:hypothetical protein
MNVVAFAALVEVESTSTASMAAATLAVPNQRRGRRDVIWIVERRRKQLTGGLELHIACFSNPLCFSSKDKHRMEQTLCVSDRSPQSALLRP